MMGHGLAAMRFGPNAVISEQEGKQLSEQICALADHYKVDLCGERTGAFMLWAGLGGTLVTVYGPKLANAVQARNADKANKAPAMAATVGPTTGARLRTVDLSGDIQFAH